MNEEVLKKMMADVVRMKMVKDISEEIAGPCVAAVEEFLAKVPNEARAHRDELLVTAAVKAVLEIIDEDEEECDEHCDECDQNCEEDKRILDMFANLTAAANVADKENKKPEASPADVLRELLK